MFPGIVEETLSRIGSLIDTLFEAAEDAIFLMDRGRFIDCNPATLQMFGCKQKEDIVGHTPFDFSPPRQPDGADSKEAASRLVASAMEGVPQRFEWRHCRLDRGEFDVEVRINRFLVNGAPFLIAVVRDVTARKEAEAALRRDALAQELINRVLAGCASCPANQVDEQMQDALRELVDFLGVEHAYFLITSSDRKTYACTHEVCGPGVAPLCPRYRNVPAGTCVWLESALLRGETAAIDSVADAPDAARWASASDPGCRSLLQLPTTGPSGDFGGALGVDSHTRRVKWTPSDLMLCSIIGNALTGLAERKRAADKLLEEKLFSERLIECVPGVFYVFDSELRLRRWNRDAARTMGFNAAELRGRRVEEWLASEEDRRRVVAAAKVVLEQGGAIDFLETTLLHKDGSLVPYLISGAHVDSPSGPMIVGMGIDVTVRVEAQKALAASERNYRELFDATSDALFIHDEAGHVLDLNERACTMFGYDAEQARRLSIEELSFGEFPYCQRGALEKVDRALHEGPQVFEWRSRRHDGTVFWSEVALRASRVGGQVRLTAAVRDITERKLAAMERERLIAEAQAASNAKDQFLAVLSHELRNPLAAIEAGIGLLRRSPAQEQPQMARALDVIERNVRLQARFVDDLLDLSRVVGGKLTIERAPVQFAEVVRSAVEACRADAARAEVYLETYAEPGLWVDVDADRIQQVIINLVGNSLKFTPKRGRVMVSVTGEEHSACVVVEDTGVGIEADQLPYVFDMFRQGQVAARRAPGLGIGLALVKSITELHGGHVRAESDGPGRGSRFTVELPRCEAPSAREAPEVAGPGRRPVKMLLVEDNSDTLTMLTETFARLAYQVVPAESGEAALEVLSHERVDVILADIGLPGMDGYEFLQEARKIPSAARTPAFALTGYGRESDVRKARDAGYVEHVVKPVDVDVIDQRIRSRLAA